MKTILTDPAAWQWHQTLSRCDPKSRAALLAGYITALSDNQHNDDDLVALRHAAALLAEMSGATYGAVILGTVQQPIPKGTTP